MKTLLRSIFVTTALLAFHLSKAQDFQISDCRPRAFTNQVQVRIDDALTQKNLAQAEPTLTMNELGYLRNRITECDKSFYGPQRDKFNGRITELNRELGQKTAALDKQSEQKAALCKDPGAEKCRADVRAAFTAAIETAKAEINRDIDFYQGQIRLMEVDRFEAVLPAYTTVLWADQLAQLLKNALSSDLNVQKFDGVKISFKKDGEKILKKEGSVDDEIRYLTEAQKSALRQKFGMPLPEALASRCDQEVCLDPELIYARFNEMEERSGEVVVDWTDSNFTHEAVLDFELNAAWTEETLIEAAEIFSHPNSEMKLHDSKDRSPETEIGSLKFSVKDQLLPSLQPDEGRPGK